MSYRIGNPLKNSHIIALIEKSFNPNSKCDVCQDFVAYTITYVNNNTEERDMRFVCGCLECVVEASMKSFMILK
jgi:hypothetical protein